MIRKKPPVQFCPQCGKEKIPRRYYRKSGQGADRYFQYFVPKKFCSKKCEGEALRNPNRVDKKGYRIVQLNDRPVFVHRLIMEQVLGRKLRRGETVHHKNGIKHDNRPENLELWAANHGNGHRQSDQDIWSGMIPSYQINCQL
jgi:hypothetical protein